MSSSENIITPIERKKENLRKAYTSKGEFKAYRMPLWVIMMIDWLADYYSVGKSHLVRSLLKRAELFENIQVPKNHPIPYLNTEKKLNLTINSSDSNIIQLISNQFNWSESKAVHAIIQTAIESEIERLNEQPREERNLGKNKLRQIYASAELRDVLFELRDRRGESLSLLLKEAVLNYRKRTVPSLPVYRKEKLMRLRLRKQEWDIVDTIAVSSELPVDETVNSLFIQYYFEGAYAEAQSRRRD